jgi:hypothetical protein
MMINTPPEYQIRTCSCVAYKEETERLTKQRDELVAALERSTRGLRNVSRWNISDDTLAAITTQIIANENALASVKGGA